MDGAFYMAKELLMTERTYKKDLQIIAVVSKGINKIFCKCDKHGVPMPPGKFWIFL